MSSYKNNRSTVIWLMLLFLVISLGTCWFYVYFLGVKEKETIFFQILFVNVLLFTIIAGLTLLPSIEKSYRLHRKYHKIILAIYLSLLVPILSYIIKIYSLIRAKSLDHETSLTLKELEIIDTNEFLIFTAVSLLGALSSVIIMDKADKLKEEAVKSTKYRWDDDSILESLFYESSDQITLVQTWFPDASRIADFFCRKFEDTNHTTTKAKKICIYLMDPDCEIALHRYKVVNGSIHQNNQSMTEEIYGKLHLAHYVSTLDNFIQRFERTQKYEVEIYKYKVPNHSAYYKVYRIDNSDLYASGYFKSGSTITYADYYDEVTLGQLDRRKNKTTDEEAKISQWKTVSNYLNDNILKSKDKIYTKKPNEKGILHEGYSKLV